MAASSSTTRMRFMGPGSPRFPFPVRFLRRAGPPQRPSRRPGGPPRTRGPDARPPLRPRWPGRVRCRAVRSGHDAVHVRIAGRSCDAGRAAHPDRGRPRGGTPGPSTPLQGHVDRAGLAVFDGIVQQVDHHAAERLAVSENWIQVSWSAPVSRATPAAAARSRNETTTSRTTSPRLMGSRLMGSRANGWRPCSRRLKSSTFCTRWASLPASSPMWW